MNIAVVMGGYSDESVISLRSGQLILQNLDAAKYKAFEVHVLTEGWFAVVNNEHFNIDKSDFFFFFYGNKTQFDTIINTVHGTPGEDGHLQAYWELLEIPYTGCNFYQSALTFNKRDTLSVLSKFNIPKANSIYLTKGMSISAEDVVAELGLPFFVKPNQSGSSLGVSKVNKIEDFEKALEFAFAEDSDILIESYLKGIEVSVGVLNLNGETKVLGLTEIVSENDFFDYEAKYEGKSQEITPARISNDMTQKVGEIAKRAYEVLKMKGFSRSEFIIVDGEPHMLEMNTIPGLTTESLIPQQARAAGISLEDLFTNAIELALN